MKLSWRLLLLALILAGSSLSAQTLHDVLFVEGEKVYAVVDSAAYVLASVDDEKERLFLEA